MAKVALILLIALNCVYGSSFTECRNLTPFGVNTFSCPRAFDDVKHVFCCGHETDIVGQRCCGTGEFLETNFGIIIGAVVGVAILLLIIILFICCCCSCCLLYKRRQPGTVYVQAPAPKV